jgi:hypothetical protein
LDSLPLDDAFVVGEMLLLRGKLFLIDVDELRPVEPDALRTVHDRRRNFLHELYIGAYFNLVMVQSHGGEFRLPQEILFQNLVVPLFFFIAFQNFRLRIDDNEPVATVNNHGIVGTYLTGDPLQAHHSRDPYGSGHDGRMGGLPPDIRGKPEDILHLHLNRVGRREVP